VNHCKKVATGIHATPSTVIHIVQTVGIGETMKLEKGLLTLTHDEFENMQAESEGVCMTCGEARDCCEPDARNYECESCGAKQVFGIEELLIMGKLVFE
jgi:hypothetical protein